MAPSLNLKDIHALNELQAGLSGFANSSHDALQAGRAELNNRLEGVRAKLDDRINEMKKDVEKVERARERFIKCENSGVYGPDGYVPLNCMGEQAELRFAERELDEAVQRVQIAQAWYGRLLETAEGYTQVQHSLDRLVREHTSQAQAALGQLAERYAAVHSSVVSAPQSGSSPASRSIQPRVQHRLQNLMVSSLPAPEGISGAADFSKVSENEMRAGIKRLQEMRPVIESGAGAASDYWADLDRQRGLSYVDGYQRIYDAFYGQDAIYVEKDGDNYDIINGRHRIWLAKQMGIDNLPMRVTERRSPQS